MNFVEAVDAARAEMAKPMSLHGDQSSKTVGEWLAGVQPSQRAAFAASDMVYAAINIEAGRSGDANMTLALRSIISLLDRQQNPAPESK